MDPLETVLDELENIREARKRLQILKLERLCNPYGELLWTAQVVTKRAQSTSDGGEILPQGRVDLAGRDGQGSED